MLVYLKEWEGEEKDSERGRGRKESKKERGTKAEQDRGGESKRKLKWAESASTSGLNLI